MNPAEWQLQRLREGLQRPAFVWSDATFTYADLEERWSRCRQELAAAGVKSGDAVAVVGDLSPASVATLLALIELDCVVVPLSREFAPFGITVNVVGPPPIDSDMIRGVPCEKLERVTDALAIGRMGTFADVSNVIDFLLREESSAVTGQTIYLGGVPTS